VAKLRFKFVHAFTDRHGKVRHYYRRPGFKAVPLPGVPGSAEFNRAYEAATATAPRIVIGDRSAPGSVSAAVATYFGSMAFGNLAPRTQRERRWILEKFRNDHGEKPVALLERSHIETMLAKKAATPGAARNLLFALRAMIAVAITAGLRPSDPSAGIQVKLRDTGGHRTWAEDEIAQFEAAHPIGTRARLAFALLHYTAQRRSDVIRMGRQHVRAGFIAVRQQKTGRVLEIPLHAELQEVIAAHSAEHMTFLTTGVGEPFTAANFTQWFRARCHEAGLPRGFTAHGLRKAVCRRLAEAGCSANQIAAISGHATLNEVSRYTKAVDQKRMAADAMKAITGTGFANPEIPYATLRRK
jgi:integrase